MYVGSHGEFRIMINYNEKYIFISDGTWYEKGTEATVEDDALWHPDFKFDEEIPYEEMIAHPEKVGGLFVGWRVCENPLSEGSHKLGDRYEDGECCTLNEFEIRKR